MSSSLNPFSDIKKFREINKKVRQQQQQTNELKKQSSFSERFVDGKIDSMEKEKDKSFIGKLNTEINKAVSSLKGLGISNLPYILVRVEYKSETGEAFSIVNFDFTLVKSLVVKDLNNNRYKRIYKKDVYSYYMEENFLFLKLRTNEKMKIRCY